MITKPRFKICFPWIETPNERRSLLATVLVCFTGVALLPTPEEGAVPAWQFLVPFLVVVVLVNSLFMWFARSRWPDPQPATLYEMAGGGYVIWTPEVPGTPSPMEYLGPNFVNGMSVAEFLSMQPPHPKRVMLLGFDDWMLESEEFSRKQEEWIIQAPSETLEQLILVAEPMLTAYPRDHELAWLLMKSEELRGIPDRDSLQGLEERTTSPPLRASLRGEHYDPNEEEADA